MKNFFKKNAWSICAGLLSLVFMWALWFIAQKTVKNEYLIPSFSQTIIAFFALLKEGFFWQSLSKTLLKVLLSFAISFVLGLIFAGVCKVFNWSKPFFKPILSVIRTLPTMAILVLILIYTNRTTAPIIVASLVLFPMIFAQFITAFDTINSDVINTTKVFNISKKEKMVKIYLPMVAPSILSHMGSNLSFAIKLVISAEVMAYTYASIGGMMESAHALIDIPRLMALTIIAILLGLIIELVFAIINKYAFKWAKGDIDD